MSELKRSLLFFILVAGVEFAVQQLDFYIQNLDKTMHKNSIEK